MQSNLEFIDIHYHASPDLYSRKYSFLEAAKLYHENNGGVVFRSHLGATSIQATIAQNYGYSVFPSINLNNINGGISYKSVLRALYEYQPIYPSKIIVDLPTLTNTKHKSKLTRNAVYPNLLPIINKPESIYSSNKIKQSLINILKLSKDYPIVLSTGHCNYNEVMDIINLGEKFNIPTLLLNQPHNPMTGMSNHNLINIATSYPFVFIEQTALTYLLGYQDDLNFAESLQVIPNLIYSSDLGQVSQPDINQWLSKTNIWFKKFNLNNTPRKDEICLANPLKLIQV